MSHGFYLMSVGCLQNAGEESIANLDKMRNANGSTPTADLRLKLQKVCLPFFLEPSMVV